MSHDQNAKIIQANGYFMINQRHEKLSAEKFFNVDELRVRNVSAKRDDHYAQIAILVEQLYPGKVTNHHGSLTLDERTTVELCKALLGDKYIVAVKV